MMPTIINPQRISEIVTGDGWTMQTVADAASIGFPAMTARWWIFQPGAQGPKHIRGGADELLYVISGSGKTVVNEREFEIDDESVIWVDEGETYYFIAGDNGLEILQGYAPGDKNNG
jgi:mannose-6-phosphate isomerase-like protein (cupin superfamily)